MRLERNAPAKINLTLEVLGRRSDGYHEIASVMHTLSLHDTLALELPDTPQLNVEQGAIVIDAPSLLAPSPGGRGGTRGSPLPGAGEGLGVRAVCTGEDARATRFPLPRAGEGLGVRAEQSPPSELFPVSATVSHLRDLSPSKIKPPLAPSPSGRGENAPDAHGSLSPSAGRGLEEEGVPTDTRNLIWKAVAAFARNCPHLQNHDKELEGEGWRALLTKRIPTQAGLGGGSSDAAATLILLKEWARRLDVDPPDLHNLATQLGVDVAFFVGVDADATNAPCVASASPPTNRCALATGIGETLIALPPLPHFWWVIVKPYGIGVPTAWAYEQLKRSELPPNPDAPPTQRLVDALREGRIKTPLDLAPLLQNDFDAPILNALPELQALRQQMYKKGVLTVILCGSGAAQAGLCQTQAQAETVASLLIQQGYWAVATQTS